MTLTLTTQVIACVLVVLFAVYLLVQVKTKAL